MRRRRREEEEEEVAAPPSAGPVTNMQQEFSEDLLRMCAAHALRCPEAPPYTRACSEKHRKAFWAHASEQQTYAFGFFKLFCLQFQCECLDILLKSKFSDFNFRNFFCRMNAI